jgi:hypothetical protein
MISSRYNYRGATVYAAKGRRICLTARGPSGSLVVAASAASNAFAGRREQACAGRRVKGQARRLQNQTGAAAVNLKF